MDGNSGIRVDKINDICYFTNPKDHIKIDSKSSVKLINKKENNNNNNKPPIGY